MSSRKALAFQLHAYTHLAQPFHRHGANALGDFVCRSIDPHLATRAASGNAYAGAVRYGHFYVVVDKKGSMKSWSAGARPPAFQGICCGRLAAGQPLKSRQATHAWHLYLAWAAKVTVGFAKRLQHCKAAERFEQDAALEVSLATPLHHCPSFNQALAVLWLQRLGCRGLRTGTCVAQIDVVQEAVSRSWCQVSLCHAVLRDRWIVRLPSHRVCRCKRTVVCCHACLVTARKPFVVYSCFDPE